MSQITGRRMTLRTMRIKIALPCLCVPRDNVQNLIFHSVCSGLGPGQQKCSNILNLRLRETETGHALIRAAIAHYRSDLLRAPLIVKHEYRADQIRPGCAPVCIRTMAEPARSDEQ